MATIGLLTATVIGGSWTLVQSQFNAAGVKEDLRHGDVNRRLDEMRELFRTIDREVERGRTDYVRKEEFRQFEQRFQRIQEALSAVEANRSTINEVNALSRSLEKRIEMIETRPR